MRLHFLGETVAVVVAVQSMRGAECAGPAHRVDELIDPRHLRAGAVLRLARAEAALEPQPRLQPRERIVAAQPDEAGLDATGIVHRGAFARAVLQRRLPGGNPPNNPQKLKIGLFNEKKEEEVLTIESLDDIFNLADRLKATVAGYLPGQEN